MKMFWLLCLCLDLCYSASGSTSPLCEPYADIVFILDSSGSIRDQYPPDILDVWYELLRFVGFIIEEFDVGLDKTRVGFVKYSTTAITEIYLNEYSNKSALIDRVKSSSYMGSHTNTAGAIREALNNVFTSENGDRSGVDDIIITLTDGPSTINVEDTVPAVSEATARGIKLFALGIVFSNLFDENILKVLSSPPQEEYENYWFLESHFDFEDFIRTVKKSITSGTCGTSPPIADKTTVDIDTTTQETAIIGVPTPTSTIVDIDFASSNTQTIPAHETPLAGVTAPTTTIVDTVFGDSSMQTTNTHETISTGEPTPTSAIIHPLQNDSIMQTHAQTDSLFTTSSTTSGFQNIENTSMTNSSNLHNDQAHLLTIYVAVGVLCVFVLGLIIGHVLLFFRNKRVKYLFSPKV